MTMPLQNQTAMNKTEKIILGIDPGTNVMLSLIHI